MANPNWLALACSCSKQISDQMNADAESAELPPYGVAFYLSSVGWHS